jgi:hypothetical protein
VALSTIAGNGSVPAADSSGIEDEAGVCFSMTEDEKKPRKLWFHALP